MSSRVPALPAPAPGLRRWRRHRDYTQTQLGALVGVSTATVCGWESGRHRPSLDTAARLVAVLDAPSIEALFPTRTDGAAA